MLAVPYSRVSSADQVAGDGLNRQQADPAAYAAARGWTLWEPTTGGGYSDAGVSAYGGKNLTEGALGRFLADVKAGRFGPDPLALLIEDLDRFSRAAPLAVLPVLIDDLLNAGHTLAVMGKGRDISRQSVKANPMELHELLFAVNSAHEFSAKISSRIGAAHRSRRERMRAGAAVNPHDAPAWIDLDTSGQWVLNGYAPAIRRIVDLVLGGDGLHVIAGALNSEGIPSPGQYRRQQWAAGAKRRTRDAYRPVLWNTASIRQVLHSPALIGDRQVLTPGHKARQRDWAERVALLRRQGAKGADLPRPPVREYEQPLRGYYPAIATEGEQAAMLAALERRHRKGLGNPSQLRWLAAGRTFCTCGAGIGAVCATRASGRTYDLRCSGRRKGTGCMQPGMRLIDAQAHLLTRLTGESFLAMIEQQNGGARVGALAAAITCQQQAQAAVDRAKAAAAAGEVALAAEADAAVLGVLARRQVALEATMADTRQVLREAQAEVQQLQGHPGGAVMAAEAQEAVRGLLQKFAAGADDVEDRRAVHRHLERLGVSVVIDATGKQVALQIGDGEPAWQPLHAGLAGEALAEGRSGVTYSTAYISENAIRDAMARIEANNLTGDELIAVEMELSQPIELNAADVKHSQQNEPNTYEGRITLDR